MKKNSSMVIGVFGHYGNQNLGDEAIIQAVIENCHRLRPEAEVWCFSGNPEDTESRHGVPSFPIRRLDKRGHKTWNTPDPAVDTRRTGQQTGQQDSRKMGLYAWTKNRIKLIPVLGPAMKFALAALQVTRDIPREVMFLARSWRIIRNVDLLMISGSNQFLDNFGGAWGFPYTLLKWSILARLAGTRVTFVSVGAGPLESRLGKIFVRLSLFLSDYHSFRDQGSRQLLSSAGFRGDSKVYPDLAFSLYTSSGITGKSNPQSGNKHSIIGINPMPYCDVRYWPDQDPIRYQKYIEKFAKFSSSLIRNGYQVFFFPTQRMDSLVIDDIISIMDGDVLNNVNPITLTKTCSTVDQLLEVINQADMVIATRFHGVLLSLFCVVPTIAICYGKKTDELMHECGQGIFSHVLETFDADVIVENVHLLENELTGVAGTLMKQKAAYVKALEQQYTDIFRLLD
jgi:polysaccharide pyruvyl transferase WcaK-like protein